ncbi:MAG: hypothetical protein BWY75_03795 [bacterium ADurb.Bin425]|nr:MAG: hypothetical protein BWY75_03795 [bacterium ADurb.Bin425]
MSVDIWFTTVYKVTTTLGGTYIVPNIYAFITYWIYIFLLWLETLTELGSRVFQIPLK